MALTPAYPYRPRGAVEGITGTKDPRQQALEDRIFAYNRGSELDIGATDDANRAAFERDAYQQRLQGAYDPFLAGQGGLTPEQMQQITRQDELGKLGMSQEEIDASYLSPEERLAVQGNVNDRRKYFNPNFEGQIFDEGAGAERGAVDQYGKSLQSAYDPNTLRPGQDFYGGLQGGVDQYGKTVQSALDPSGLTVSDKFLQDYQLTPEEQQNIVTSAAATVGTRDKAAVDELQRKARAAGTNPLGVAALRDRMERGASANAADAATAARIGAESEAARRMQTGEQMRLNAGQNLAGLRTDVAGRQADLAYRGTTTGEQARVQAEKDLADRNTNAAERSGSARIDSEADLARRRLALQQHTTDTGTAIERDVEGTQQARDQWLAQNRQGNEQYVQGNRYNRGAAASSQLSDRYKYGAEQQRADAAEARNYYTGSQAQSNQNYQAAQGRQQALYGMQTGAGQQATGQQAQIANQEANRPKLWEKIAGLAIGGASAAVPYFGSTTKKRAVTGGAYAQGGMITQPTYALLGEAGPEMVVPLDGAQNPEVLPGMALQPGQPPPFNTAPPVKPRPPYSQQYRYVS